MLVEIFFDKKITPSKWESSSDPSIPSENNKYPDNDVFPHKFLSDTPPILSKSVTHTSEDDTSPYHTNNLNFSDFSIDSKPNNSSNKKCKSKEVNRSNTSSRTIMEKETDIKCMRKSDNDQEKSYSFSKKMNAHGQRTALPPNLGSPGISRSHQKLLDKYQSILDIDLDLFNGTLDTFKTRIARIAQKP